MENEIQVQKLAAIPEVFNATTHQERVPLLSAPTRNDLSSGVGFRNESGFYQPAGDPGATHLVLFPKLPARAGADKNHSIVTSNKAPDSGAVVTKTGDVGAAPSELMHQTRSGGRKE